ncbi:hypothetical protein BDDG_13334 [Blastomyces dermatitidis ATCC 18188]|uniref:Uncharacterized protein n=1 Tax=Ajellomyces dermatitidis (strain ATCC 18188 / CBS 674.68) TaxID=653446 RepID=A0A0J9EVH3_AJEDA|nr:hypothetical protein BDDG_13334 [Blastomyces dermatitidis ATCC 18188]
MSRDLIQEYLQTPRAASPIGYARDRNRGKGSARSGISYRISDLMINRFTTNSLGFSNKNPPIDPSKSPRSYEHFDPIADRIPRVVVELSSQM